MIISIENTSSPGASFTKNTNDVLLKTYEWIREHKDYEMPFYDFRMSLQEDKKINDNNNRNIYPLLRNCGLVNYDGKGKLLPVDHFFTKTGLAYVKTLQAANEIQILPGYTKEQIMQASKKFDEIISEIVFKGLKILMEQPDVNYVEPFQDLIKFIIAYEKICKEEFAYLIFEKKQAKRKEDVIQNVSENIKAFRNKSLSFDVQVMVRNDISLRERTHSEYRVEGISYLTSYGYFIGLLQQADLVFKDGKYFKINASKRSLLASLGGGV